MLQATQLVYVTSDIRSSDFESKPTSKSPTPSLRTSDLEISEMEDLKGVSGVSRRSN
jgi:hypothetical protein